MDFSFDPSQDIRFSVGELSEMYGVTSRTLRLYHERGLLVPEHIDTRTGYRYYSTSQLPRLEMILQMKNVGLSLKRIENILETKGLSVFEALLNEQIDELDEKIVRYTTSRKALTRQLNSCRFLRNPPALDHVFIEFIPKRRAITFDIDEYDFRGDYGEVSPWKLGLDRIRAAMTSEASRSRCSARLAAWFRARACKRGGFCAAWPVFCSTPSARSCRAPRSSPASMPACTASTSRWITRQESVGLQLLMDYIAENGYQIVGPYLGQVIAETSVFNYSNRNILVKQQIPVALPD